MLRETFNERAELSVIDLDFDVEITGFDTVDIDRLAASPDEQASGDPAAPVSGGADWVADGGEITGGFLLV